MTNPRPTSGRPQRVPQDADMVARELLTLGWVVRSRRVTGHHGVPVLLVSRTAFDAIPTTVHVFPHHHFELEEAATGVSLGGVDDVEDLHRHLNEWGGASTLPGRRSRNGRLRR